MAQPKKQPDPEVIALLALVMRLADVANPTELAAKLGKGYETPNQIRKVYKWAEGVMHPNGPSTMLLLRTAGLLSEAPPEEVGAKPDRHAQILRSLEDAVGAMVETQTKLLADLTDARIRLKQLEDAQPSMRGQKRRRTA